MVTIKRYKPHKVPSDLAQKLRSLTLREIGYMRSEFSDMRQTGYGSVWVCSDGDYVLGWALKRHRLAQFYVRKSERQKGIGSKLMRKVYPYTEEGWADEGIVVVADEEANTHFFEKFQQLYGDSKFYIEHRDTEEWTIEGRLEREFYEKLDSENKE